MGTPQIRKIKNKFYLFYKRYVKGKINDYTHLAPLNENIEITRYTKELTLARLNKRGISLEDFSWQDAERKAKEKRHECGVNFTRGSDTGLPKGDRSGFNPRYNKCHRCGQALDKGVHCRDCNEPFCMSCWGWHWH